MLVSLLKRIPLFLFLISPLWGQTKVDWPTQVKRKPSLYASDYGVTPNGSKSCQVKMTSGSHTLTTVPSEVPFTSSDIGSVIWGTNQGCEGTNGQSNVGFVGFQGTIATVVDGHTITFTGPASIISCDGTTGSGGCEIAWYKTDQTTFVQAAYNALMASANGYSCGLLIFPSGFIPITAPILAPAGSLCGVNPNGNFTSPQEGYGVQGMGQNSTVFLIDPIFDAAIGGGSDGKCLMFCPPAASNTGQMYLSDFRLDGGGNRTVLNGDNKEIFYCPQNAVIRNVGIQLWGNGNTNLAPFLSPPQSFLNGGLQLFDNVTVNNGGTNCGSFPGGQNLYMYNCGNPVNAFIGSPGAAASVNSVNSYFGNGPGGGLVCDGVWNSVNDSIGTIGGQTYSITAATGCSAHLSGASIGTFPNAPSATFSLSGVGGAVYLRDSRIATPGGSQFINSGAVGTFIDEGGNSGIASATTIFSGGAGLFIPNQSIGGSCSGVATASSTLGLYDTGQNVSEITCISTAIGSGKVMDRVGTVAVLQAKASIGGVAASSGVVTVLKNGSTTTLTCTFGTGTSCVDGTHKVTFSAGDRISIQFTTQGSETLASVWASAGVF